MSRYVVPLGVFAIIVIFLFVGLSLRPREVPSPLIGRPSPAFMLAQLHEPQTTFSPQDMQGHVWLLNVWASWCVSCHEEHPLLVEMARANAVPLIGLNYKDDPADAKAWLERYGNPYRLSLSDRNGRVGIDFGVYGVPETFVIDKAGVIRHKHIGPLDARAIEDTIIPLVRRLNEG